ncbi:MAG: hypothetical protein ACPGVK_02655 [Halocynthiibacter sp.]
MTKNEILEAIERERAQLMSGEFHHLTAAVDTKDRVIQAIDQGTFSTEDITQFKEKIDRNQAILLAMIEGARAAQAQIRLLKQTATRLNTYGSNGQMQHLSTGASSHKIKRI